MSGLRGFVGFLCAMVAGPQNGNDPLLELLPGHGGAVAVLNVKTESEHVAQEREGKTSHLLAGASIEHGHSSPSRFQPTVEFIKQSRFADASIADHRGELQFAVLESNGALVLQALQFGVAPDHAGLNSLDAAAQQLKHARFDLA